jgi:hypothetical protein
MELLMHPPVDPWGSPIEPTSPQPPSMYGRAAVPEPGWQHPTTEEPAFTPTAPLPGARRRRMPMDTRELGRRVLSGRAEREHPETPRAPMPHVSWQRSGLASRRKLFDGWGFSAAGLLILFCGWGVWAAASPTNSDIPRVFNLLFVIAVGGIVFAALRFLSRVVIDGIQHRQRPHARWAHFLTGVFLATVGISYFLHNAFLTDAITWIREIGQRL